MSYSRWTNSRWYTYWQSRSDTHIFKEDQYFCVDCSFGFTYAELMADLDACVQSAERYCKENHKQPPLKDDLQELRGYMINFCEDVETDADLVSHTYVDKMFAQLSDAEQTAAMLKYGCKKSWFLSL